MQLRWLLLLASLLLLGFLLYYSDFFQVLSYLRQANLVWIALGFLLWFVGMVVRVERWRYLLRKVKIKIHFWQTAKVYIAGQFLSDVTPAKTGDPLRSVLLKAMDGRNIGYSLPSIFMERMFDVIVTVLISLLGLAFLALAKISLWMILVTVVYIIVFGIGLYVITSESRTKKFFKKLLSLFSFSKFFKNLGKKAERFSIDLHRSFMLYKDKKVLFATFIYTLIVWSLEGLIMFISFVSLGIFVNPLVTIAVTAVSVLVAVLTFLPGGLGSSEAVTILIFTTLFHLTAAEVMAAAILTRLFGYWIYVLAGSILLGSSRYKVSI